MVEDKAQADAKAQHTRQYVSILSRPATPYSAIRWGFKTSYRHFPVCQTEAIPCPDMTETMKLAPHGNDILDRFPIVGKLRG
jgi:hypothetical protein